jgi:probable DNA metabolism protein
MMTIVEYDGSFAGLLTAIFEIYEYRLADVQIVKNGHPIQDVFAERKQVDTNDEKAKRVWAGIGKKISKSALRQLYWYYLSEEKGFENKLYNYIKYVLSSIDNIEQDYTNETVLRIAQTVRKVGREKHRMEAFVRFQLTKDDIYYATVEPDFNVLPLILPHFKSRYADQHWLIYDLRRKYGIYFDKHNEHVSEVTITHKEVGKDAASIFRAGEEMYQQLWKDYFKSTGIPERKNIKLHIQHVPKRYWKCLTEKQL